MYFHRFPYFCVLIITQLLFAKPVISAGGTIEIEYNNADKVLTIRANAVGLDDVLTAIARKIDYQLYVSDSLKLSDKNDIELSGALNDVLTRLVRPNSVITSTYSDDKYSQHGYRGAIWVIKEGEENSKFITNTKIEIPNVKESDKNTYKKRRKSMTEEEWKQFNKNGRGKPGDPAPPN